MTASTVDSSRAGWLTGVMSPVAHRGQGNETVVDHIEEPIAMPLRRPLKAPGCRNSSKAKAQRRPSSLYTLRARDHIPGHLTLADDVDQDDDGVEGEEHHRARYGDPVEHIMGGEIGEPACPDNR